MDDHQELIKEIHHLINSADSSTNPQLTNTLTKLRNYLWEDYRSNILNSFTQAINTQIDSKFDQVFELLQGNLQELREERQLLRQEVQLLGQQRQELMEQMTQMLLERAKEVFGQQIAPALQHIQSSQTHYQQIQANIDTILQYLIEQDPPTAQLLSAPQEVIEAELPKDAIPDSSVLWHNLKESEKNLLTTFLPHQLEEDIEQIKLLSDLISPPFDNNYLQNHWYMGLELGDTSISAQLINTTNNTTYPLYWPPEGVEQPPRFRVDIAKLVPQLESCPTCLDVVLSSQALSSSPIQRALQEILSVKPQGAIGLAGNDFTHAIAHLQGVIINTPVLGNEALRFNLREIILKSQIIPDASQIFFLEEPIALVMLYLYEQPTRQAQTTLVLTMGPHNIQMALVDLPPEPHQLKYYHFTTSILDYGTKNFEQEIVSKLFYPQLIERLQPIKAPKLEQLLEQSQGSILQEAAKLASGILQSQESFTCPVGKYDWTLTRNDVDNEVVEPLIKSLELELSKIMAINGQQLHDIQQILCKGELMSYIVPKLHACLPQAEIHSIYEVENKLAQGLAIVPLIPEVMDKARHQYGDYFLFKEILEIVPSESFSLEQIKEQLARRGINTRVCIERVLNILDGHLPAGILPQASLMDYSSYQELNSTNIFSKEQNLYKASPQKCRLWLDYLNGICANTEQKLREPLLFNLSMR